MDISGENDGQGEGFFPFRGWGKRVKEWGNVWANWFQKLRGTPPRVPDGEKKSPKRWFTCTKKGDFPKKGKGVVNGIKY